VVATDVGAFPELIAVGDGATGMLIGRDDVSAMADAAASLMDQEVRLSHYAANARPHVTVNFSIEGEATKLRDVYERLT
jgi:mannosyltransferase